MMDWLWGVRGKYPAWWSVLACALESKMGAKLRTEGWVQKVSVRCHSLLLGIFSTQGSNPGLPHCRQILYHLTHQGRMYYDRLQY